MEYIIALVGGILTFISPCILPLIPVYIAYITGISVKELKENQINKSMVFVNSIFFVLGFTIIFTLFAILFFILSLGMSNFKIWFSRIAGFIIVIFGLHLIGVFKINLLNFQLKAELNTKKTGILSSFILGVAFGAGWTPCVGPILSGILVLSSQSNKMLLAIIQLIFYSMGIGIPFLLTALFLNRLVKLIEFFKKHSKIIEIISGLFLVVLGILIMTGLINNLSRYLPILNFEEEIIKLKK